MRQLGIITGPAVALAGILVAADTGAADYKTPADMTPADRQALMAASSEYESCVRRHVGELAERIGDPRALADAAMASCGNQLTDFAEEMAAANYHPDFSNYYINKVKRRVAGNAVRQALIIASQKQRNSDGWQAGENGPGSE